MKNFIIVALLAMVAGLLTAAAFPENEWYQCWAVLIVWSLWIVGSGVRAMYSINITRKRIIGRRVR